MISLFIRDKDWWKRPIDFQWKVARNLHPFLSCQKFPWNFAQLFLGTFVTEIAMKLRATLLRYIRSNVEILVDSFHWGKNFHTEIFICSSYYHRLKAIYTGKRLCNILDSHTNRWKIETSMGCNYNGMQLQNTLSRLNPSGSWIVGYFLKPNYLKNNFQETFECVFSKLSVLCPLDEMCLLGPFEWMWSNLKGCFQTL